MRDGDVYILILGSDHFELFSALSMDAVWATNFSLFNITLSTSE